MAGVDDEISREVLEVVSTESFAQNISNHRSLLLKWEKEVKDSSPSSKRALAIYKDSFLLQGIIEQQIKNAGVNARQLGVPPEALQENLKIYKRVMVLISLKIGAELDLYSSRVEQVLRHAEEASAEDDLKSLASNIKMARLALDKITSAPQTIDLIGAAFLQLAQQIESQLERYGGLKMFDIAGVRVPAPPSPPIDPPRASPPGGGDDLPRRVERLEIKVDAMSESINSIKIRLERIDERVSQTASKKDLEDAMAPIRATLAQLGEKLKHVPTKAEMYVAGGGALAIVLGVMAKGFKWL